MGNAIELQGITKTFGKKVAVKDLDLAIPEGMLAGLIGPNGAGKTTSIRMIMSILFPDAGRLSVLGKASAIESKDRIGYLPEERGLYRKMRAGAFLEYVARLKGIDATGLTGRVRGWLDRVGLSDCYRKKCEEMSKGMQQKVQFVAAIIHEPDLIILDEPFSGLDPVNTRLLRTLIDEQHRKGRTIIFSTHQMSQAEALCQRVIMIHEGRKVLDNTPEEIRSRFDPRSVFVLPAPGADEQTLRGVEGVQDVHTSNGGMTAVLRADAEAISVLPRIAAVVPCHRLEVVRPTLEDVFIEIVSAGGTGPGARAMVAPDGSIISGDGGGD